METTCRDDGSWLRGVRIESSKSRTESPGKESLHTTRDPDSEGLRLPPLKRSFPTGRGGDGVGGVLQTSPASV